MMKCTILVSLMLLATATGLAQKYHLVTGTYTNGKSEGIYIGSFDAATGAYEAKGTLTGIKNPSFVVASPKKDHLYAVSEAKDGKVFSYSFDRTAGKAVKINEQSSGGDDPCHLEVDHAGKWVAAGNYSSGSLSILPISSDGSLGKATDRIVHQGSGYDKTREESSHVHETVFSADDRFLYVPDLGLDRVYIYAFDQRSGKLTPASQPWASMKPGSGPRHIAFHRTLPIAYVLNELSGMVTVFSVDRKTGGLKELHSLSTLPAGATGQAGCAEVQVSPDGRFLYGSNRYEQNTIAIYAIDQKSGDLRSIAFPSTLGKHPRYFCFDPTGNWLLAANRDTDQVVLFRVDKKTGLLTDSGKRISIPAPVSLLFIKPLK